MDDDVIIVQSEDSENSVVELEVPKKPSPPLINVEDEEIILNVTQENERNILAKDFIGDDKELSVEPKRPGHSQYSNNCPNHWTKDMIKFYDDDWGDEEHFVVEKMQEKMDKTPSLWKISQKDILSTQYNMWNHNIKCWNCKQRGHHFSLCPEPPYVPKCYMCGCEGHVLCSCPNSKCLNCGSRSREYVTCCYKCRSQQKEICSRCHMIGHNFNDCPDHWRLFHLTTATTSVIVPVKNVNKSIKDIWCCNCGKQGHYHTQCTGKKHGSHFMDTLPFVVSYERPFRNDYLKNKDKIILNGMHNKKPKGKRRRDKLEKILQLNPMHRGIKKDNINFTNKYKKFRKFKKNKKKKRENQNPWNCLTV